MTARRFLLFALVVATLFGWPSAASATPIVYNINRTIGAGTVVGYVTTDGTLGVLGGGNILDWVLTLAAPNLNGGSPDVINFATQAQTLLFGSSLTATGTQLLFNFSLPGLFLMQGTAPDNFWCLEGVGGVNCANTGPGEMMGRTNGTGSIGTAAQFVSIRTGVLEIGTTAVPEPATLLLLGTGLAAVAVRRRFTKRT